MSVYFEIGGDVHLQTPLARSPVIYFVSISLLKMQKD
jgi:hypothetical protein